MIAARATRFVRALLILIHLFDVIDKTKTSNDQRPVEDISKISSPHVSV